MDFTKRLEKAIERGERQRDEKGLAQARAEMNEEDLRNLHSGLRIEFSEHIETLLRQLSDHFPGFEFKTVVDEAGWGARISRDDVNLKRGATSRSAYSRLELLVTPFTSTHIIEVTAKGTIRNRETISRKHYQFLTESDADSFRETIDLWVLEFAEQYAAES